MSKIKMKKARWLGVAAASAVAVSALGASGAQASQPLLTACSGSSIAGQGSSLQRASQAIWNVDFNVNANGCTASGAPTAAYTVSSSGVGLSAWHAASTDPALNTVDGFIGTDDAPTSAQITSINSPVASGGSGASVLSIPVAQAAIAILVNPPANCSITNATPAKVEAAFNGTGATTWSALGAAGSGCSAAITRVVRTDGSGTSYQLKHYLFTKNSAALDPPATLTWADYQASSLNTSWPGPAGTVMKSAAGGTGLPGTGSGGGDEAKTVANNPGSIGYAALADARSVYNTTTFPNYKWLNLTSGITNVNPSSNGVSATKANSNCTTGANAYGTTLPAATASWSGTYLVTPGTNYPLCTLTWDLALSSYGPAFGNTGTPTNGQKVATTVHDYLKYMLTTGGGQLDALSSANDYKAVPSDVQTAANAGIAQILG